MSSFAPKEGKREEGKRGGDGGWGGTMTSGQIPLCVFLGSKNRTCTDEFSKLGWGKRKKKGIETSERKTLGGGCRDKRPPKSSVLNRPD